MDGVSQIYDRFAGNLNSKLENYFDGELDRLGLESHSSVDIDIVNIEDGYKQFVIRITVNPTDQLDDNYEIDKGQLIEIGGYLSPFSKEIEEDIEEIFYEIEDPDTPIQNLYVTSFEFYPDEIAIDVEIKLMESIKSLEDTDVRDKVELESLLS